MENMNPKNILITGAGSGFGRAMGIRLASEGHNLILNDVNENGLKETEKLIKEHNIKILLQVGDVSDSKSVQNMISNTKKEFQVLHVIINNAGVSGEPTNMIDVSEEDLDHVMNVNFKGYWLLSKYAAKLMKKQKDIKPIRGKIINVASDAGKYPMPLIGPYSCSKAAVIALTKVLSRELAPRITVNAICPGFHVTGIYNNDPKLIETFMETLSLKIPLKRLGTAEDVTGMISFLVSEDSNYITGQSFNVDGGVLND